MTGQERSDVPQRSNRPKGTANAATISEALLPQPKPMAKAARRNGNARLSASRTSPRSSRTAATKAMLKGTDARTRPTAKAVTAPVMDISFGGTRAPASRPTTYANSAAANMPIRPVPMSYGVKWPIWSASSALKSMF